MAINYPLTGLLFTSRFSFPPSALFAPFVELPTPLKLKIPAIEDGIPKQKLQGSCFLFTQRLRSKGGHLEAPSICFLVSSFFCF